jgi:hypothetical protein
MKKMKFNKKLSLNKRTISHLNNVELEGIKGGTETIEPTTCWICESQFGNCTIISDCYCESYPQLCYTDYC